MGSSRVGSGLSNNKEASAEQNRKQDQDSVDETAAGERREARTVGAWERSELGLWMGIKSALRLVLVSSVGRADRKALPQSCGCVVR